MNQTPLFTGETVGVGFFHNCFPPTNSIGINPNPTSHSNPSRDLFVKVHPIFSSESCLVYRGTPISSLLTTVSRGNISFTSPLETPADNYTIDFYNYKKSGYQMVTGNPKKEYVFGNHVFNIITYQNKVTYLT